MYDTGCEYPHPVYDAVGRAAAAMMTQQMDADSRKKHGVILPDMLMPKLDTPAMRRAAVEAKPKEKALDIDFLD